MYIASIAPLFMIIPMLMILASSILFAIWVYKDAEANGEMASYGSWWSWLFQTSWGLSSTCFWSRGKNKSAVKIAGT